MIFTPEYSLKMSFGEALLTAVVGILTVLVILAVIDVLIMIVSKIVRVIEKSFSSKEAVPEEKLPDASASVINANESQGQLELVGVDEPTAAVIMAVVSDKSGIPLERLSFKSIKLLEEE